MNERQPNIERYQTMTPQERNAEMKGLFNLLPDFNATFTSTEFDEDGKRIDISTLPQRVDNVIEHRKKSTLRQILAVRLKNLLSFTTVTDSFKSSIINWFEHGFEKGIVREPTEFMGITFPNETDSYTRFFQWDSPESGGVFSEDKAKEIERRAYKGRVWLQLELMRMLEEVGGQALALDYPDYVEKNMERIKKEKQNFEVAKQFLSDEGLEELEFGQIVNNSQWESFDRYQKERELVNRWRDEFIQRYGDEP